MCNSLRILLLNTVEPSIFSERRLVLYIKFNYSAGSNHANSFFICNSSCTRNGEFDVLITNPHTLAESVSLHTVCHDAIYYEYSYNLVHLLQSKDRIHRLGLPDEPYTQYYFLQNVYDNGGEEFSMNRNVYERLRQKEQTMLDAIDDQELEPVYTSEEDLQIIFGDLL